MDVEAVRIRKQSEALLPTLGIEELRLFKHVFGFLNEKDRDILYLVFVSQKKQKDVQVIIGRSQPLLCYDIKRIKKRLKFIFYIQSVMDIYLNFVTDWEAGNHPEFTSKEISVLTLMLYTSSYSMAARVLGKSQVKVRYVFLRLLDRFRENKMWELYEIFSIIKDNLNMIRRIVPGGDFNKS